MTHISQKSAENSEGEFHYFFTTQVSMLTVQIHEHFPFLLGFIKATESDKPPSLHIGQLGNMAVKEHVKAIKKKLLNPLKALQGMRPRKSTERN